MSGGVLLICGLLICIYIPIWLDYEFRFGASVGLPTFIYIPIWLDYEARHVRMNGSDPIFTFQYG